jgi:hypothetical protein
VPKSIGTLSSGGWKSEEPRLCEAKEGDSAGGSLAGLAMAAIVGEIDRQHRDKTRPLRESQILGLGG